MQLWRLAGAAGKGEGVKSAAAAEAWGSFSAFLDKGLTPAPVSDTFSL
jgi:hypothetical protein